MFGFRRGMKAFTGVIIASHDVFGSGFLFGEGVSPHVMRGAFCALDRSIRAVLMDV